MDEEGSNSSHRQPWKVAWQRLADELEMEIPFVIFPWARANGTKLSNRIFSPSEHHYVSQSFTRDSST
jgi:hypothetical protein